MKVVKEPTRLSYSSATLLQNCEARYFHYKVAKTPIDPDSDESTEAFNIGKAFHGTLEATLHEYVDNLTDVVRLQCGVNECIGKEALVEGMCLKYLDLNELIGLKTLLCEFEIKTDCFIGYIDAIMYDAQGNWWITDLKTAAQISPMLLSKLKRDTQLNLYGSYHDLVAKALDLDLVKFKGMRYRVTTKPKLIMKSTENYASYVQRIKKSAKSCEVVIPKNMDIMDMARKKHQELWIKADAMHTGKIEPTQNLTYCDSYFKPCPYFSQCYGATFTECANELRMVDADSINNDLEML